MRKSFGQQTFIEKFREIIQKNLSNSELNVGMASKEIGMSRVQLYRKSLAIIGEPPSSFIRITRIKLAAKELKNSSNNISDIAYATGFSSLSYFTKSFKEVFNQTPSEFIKEAKRKISDD